MKTLIHSFARCRLGRFSAVLICSAQLVSAQDPAPPGSVDATFAPPFDSPDSLSIVVQPDGRLLVAGSMSLSRWGSNGSYDPTFALAPNRLWPYVTTIALQPDGKVLVACQNREYASLDRFNADGSLDSSFHGLEVLSDPCYTLFGATALVFQPDGKLLGTGQRYVAYDCSGDDPYWTHPRLYRWLPNGDLDSSFAPNGRYAAETCILLTNNQILVNGGRSLSRLQPDGTQDTNFVAGPFSDGIECLAIQPDGRVLVGGYFTNVQGQPRSLIARLLSDGHLDSSFNPPTIIGAVVRAIAVQTDGRILIGGEFDAIGGLANASLARLNADGTLDTSFFFGQYLDEPGVATLLIQDETHALVAGGYGNDVGPPLPGHFFRVHLGEPAPCLSIHQDAGGLFHLNYPYSGSYDFAVAFATNLTLPASNWTVLGSATNAGAAQFRFTDRVDPYPAQRFYKLRRSRTP